ncbi:hypothetical protein HYV80_01695 [Candidatus Woesearchaeota archaeon]|nr:hypothetical protein [Candidatus Woesearchaeota archaeon]
MEEELYKDISEIKKGLEGMKGKKDISSKELYDAVQSLNTTITGMLDVFGAAAEQMKLEEQSYEASLKKHEMIITKLDKLIDQNKTIAEGMVAIVEMVKEKIAAKEEPMFRPRQEPRQFIKPQQEWKPMPEQKPAFQQQPQPSPMQLTPPIPSVPEMGMPSMQPTQDLDFPEFDLGEEEPKKKGLFGMFKK